MNSTRKVLQSPHNQINDQTKNMKNFKPNPSSKILEEKKIFYGKRAEEMGGLVTSLEVSSTKYLVGVIIPFWQQIIQFEEAQNMII